MRIQRNSNRVQRVAQEIQKKISVILQNDIHDPRIGMPTISAVLISRDLKYAKVFITFLDRNDPEEIRMSIMILQSATCFIRFLLAKSVYLRVVPILLFKYDSSLSEGRRISNLLEKVIIAR